MALPGRDMKMPATEWATARFPDLPVVMVPTYCDDAGRTSEVRSRSSQGSFVQAEISRTSSIEPEVTGALHVAFSFSGAVIRPRTGDH
jgi:hypothetical protein